MKLLDFNLEKALKNPERIVFIDGSKVVDFKYFPTASTEFNLFVQSEKGQLFNFNKNGKLFDSKSIPSLKLLPLTKTYYYCLFEDKNNELFTSHYFLFKEEMYRQVTRFDGKILQEHSYNVEIPE